MTDVIHEDAARGKRGIPYLHSDDDWASCDRCNGDEARHSAAHTARWAERLRVTFYLVLAVGLGMVLGVNWPG